jgi:Zn2+/Cd2+-exporting ATPase
MMLLIAINFAGNITLPIGVVGHEGSTVLVILSGLRLLRN